MADIHRSALLPFPAQDVFELVNEVGSYPDYMDGCVGAQVLSRTEDSMTARLDLSKAGVSQSFTTSNELRAGESIRMTLVDGPFEHFEGLWNFQPLGAVACKVTLDLHFSLTGAVASAAAGKLFAAVGNNLVDALCKRANEKYG
ncbi:MAG: type II toxin-antitoxin system RatA family toxin [Pseudomonadales bacterium]